MNFTKKPVTIQAVQWDGNNFDAISKFTGQWHGNKGAHEDAEEGAIKSGTIYISTLEGTMTASKGDYIIKGIKGEFYPCKPDIFEATYSAGFGDNNEIGLLINLQAELGYVQGDISTVAMLGLVGEAGEVLNEVHIGTNSQDFVLDITNAIQTAKVIDQTKKKIRKGLNGSSVHLTKPNEENFDSELADTFYYLQILATNRGLTIQQLAKMAYDKIKAKQAGGGSSEDKK